ncbi:MAG: protoheme IX farnesyltransferase [Chloroflexi bacterium]|nr:protoheme IX farnesyltransferase [Chloroflexota bacterium]
MSSQPSESSTTRGPSTITGRPHLLLHPKHTSKPFLALLIAAAFAVFLLVTIGGTVRVTGSGLGCPDWPLCHGRIIPPLQFNTLVEYSHRLAASITSPLIILAAVAAWWRYRGYPLITVPLTASLALLAVEVVLGGVTVLAELPPAIVTVHLATAQAIFALLLTTIVWYWQKPLAEASASPGLRRWAAWGALATFAVLLSGSYIVGQGAGSACDRWPLCDGGLFPTLPVQWLNMAHRLLAAAGGLLALGIAMKASRAKGAVGSVRWAGALIGAAALGQMLVGAANPWTQFSDLARIAHLSLATALWGASVVLLALAWRPSAAESSGRGVLALGVIADYLLLTKPLIIMLLLLTALGSMFLAAQGAPPASTVFLVLIGGALGAGGANAINHYLDRDIDLSMARTRVRPIPGQRVSPRKALLFGILLNVLAFALLTAWVNLLSAILTLAATLFYVFVYTLWLKRITVQNIVIGGAAGAFPPLVGWAAVTGSLSLPALYLFAIVFFWTPPHFWALAIMLQSDYAKAKVPMMPVVLGVPETTRQVLLHSLILVTLTILFVTVYPVGWLYTSGAIVLGAYFLYLAWRLFRNPGIPAARRLYLYSLLYLALIFTLAIAGVLLGI